MPGGGGRVDYTYLILIVLLLYVHKLGSGLVGMRTLGRQVPDFTYYR